jgi:hypothetical protein
MIDDKRPKASFHHLKPLSVIGGFLDDQSFEFLSTRTGNRIQRRFRPAGSGLLFDNSLNYEGLRLDRRMEKGYDKGCKRGAKKIPTNSMS